MTKRRTLLGLLGSVAIGLGMSSMAMAAEYNFNLQSFLPAQATIPAKIIDVWADKIEAASGDRIEITRYAAMQLGGKPPQLIDQVGMWWATPLDATLPPKFLSCPSLSMTRHQRRRRFGS